MVSRDQPYSQRILEILLPRRFLPQNYRKCMGRGLPREPSLLLERSFGRGLLSNVASKSLIQYSVEPTFNVSLAKIRGLDLDSNDIDELVEEHDQELTTKELMELHCDHQSK
ncbi:hypothetical protein AVEN_226073-1 [Araneus ventricosus]|uniref:Uncharacterized protein n=1 Tax=Araneus ventricosus TaxID=182803 RepID=A0A4Y2GVP0_ARAVE|nr:hypothetical protein AVEN_226073-1 [Araneus ventricosus]